MNNIFLKKKSNMVTIRAVKNQSHDENVGVMKIKYEI